MRLRPDFAAKEKETLMKLLDKEKQKLIKISKKDAALEFYRAVSREIKVMKFITNLRKKIIRKKEMKKRAQEKAEKDEYLQINKNERLEIEEQAIGMKGSLMVVRKQFKQSDVLSATAQELSANNKKYDKFYLTIQDDFMLMKEKSTSNDFICRIYFSKVENIGVVSANKCLFFTFAAELWLLIADNEDMLKRWTKTITFMKEECNKKENVLTFERYELTLTSAEIDHTFSKDEPDYSYDSVKFKQKVNKEFKSFNTMNIKIDDADIDNNKLNRSIEMLSDDSDDEHGYAKEDTKGKPKAGQNPKQGGQENEDFWNDAKRWMGFL
jgi:hypothetical protein